METVIGVFSSLSAQNKRSPSSYKKKCRTAATEAK